MQEHTVYRQYLYLLNDKFHNAKDLFDLVCTSKSYLETKTDASKGCNYYLSDLKSDCNNGIKLLGFSLFCY